MRVNRVANLLAIIVLIFLAACSSVQTPGSAVQPANSPTSQALDLPTAQPPSQPAGKLVSQPTAVPAPTPTRAPLPPTVVSVTPAQGEEQRLDAPVLITFDQPMNPTTTGAAFSIEPKVAGEVKVQGDELSFLPGEQLKRDAQYQVTVTATASSQAGLPLQQPVSFKFTTVGFLEVTGTQPTDGADNTAVDDTITVAFNRPVVPLTGAGDQANLPQPLIITPTIPGKGEWINTSIYRFTLENGLAASTSYSVTVKAGLEDSTGGLLAEPYTFGFRTADPTIVRWQPENTINVKIEGTISVTFSMPMDHASTQAAFSLVDDAGKPVAGAFTWAQNDMELGFKPAQVLKFGVAYEAAVAATARAANGEGTLRAGDLRVLAFRTVPLPSVARTEPSQGNKSADSQAGVRFQFAGPMNPASFVSGTITILPRPTQVYTYYNDMDNALFLDFDKSAATAYTITLSGKLADLYGNTLGEDYVLRFSTRDYDPILQLNGSTQVGTYSAYTQTEAVVLYRNVPEVKFSLYSVTPDEFIRLTGQNGWEAWDKYQPQSKNLIRQWSVPSKAARNQIGFMREPLLGANGQPLPPGIYYLMLGGITTAGQSRPPRQILVRSDMNVTLKAGQDEALAWATDLKSGQPIADATVRFADNGKNNVRATADADGVAQAALPAARNVWDPLLAIVTTPGGSFGIASTTWQDGISPWDFHVQGGVQPEPYVGYVYTDRPIYRPDQTVYWKGVFRREDDARFSLPVAGQPVTVTINDDQGNQLLQQTLGFNTVGAVDGKLVLGPDASLGYYFISLQIDKEHSYGVGFQVAEYRKPGYELSAKTLQPEYIQGEQIDVTGQASYFFGGPVTNGKVKWVLSSTDAPFQYQGEGYWSFEDYDWYTPDSGAAYGGQISQGEGVTDADGRFTFSVPADISKFTRSQRFTFDITVEDINNQAVSTQATAVVHKGEFYIGLKPRSYVVVAGQPAQMDVITVDPHSQPVPNIPVTLIVNQVEWKSVREQAEDGNYYWTTRAKMTPVVTQTLTTDATGAAVLNWTPETPGEYKIAATARDTHGHTIRSAAYTWVSGTEYVPWRTENNDRLELVADKTEYQVGDVAEILVTSPYQGKVKALLTTERGHILSAKVIELTGNSEVLKLPITADDAPDVFVSLVVVKGIDETNPTPSFKVGLVQLKVSVADKQLQVIVTPVCGGVACAVSTDGAPPTFAPRDTVAWTVKTLDAAGKPVQADVSLALVDKAVLSLADDNAGLMMDRFYYERGLGVQTGATLVLSVDRLIAQLVEGGKGGGGGGGGPTMSEVRQEFPDSAFWQASVKTGPDGTAQVVVTLPDNLTTWTMDARATTTDTLVGQSKTDIIATKDLLVRPVLPRFFIEGDRAEIGGVVNNTTGNPLDVTVTIDAAGLTLSGVPEQKVSVPASGTAKVTWPVTAASVPAQDQVTVTLHATGGALSDAVQIALPVYRYTTPEVVGTSGQVGLDESRLELVRLPANADPTRGELDVTLEPSLAAGMLGGLTYLEHYPYECTEQTLSRFLPNVISYQALKKLGLSNPDLEAKLPQEVGVGLQRLYARQHVDGGWGWWTNDDSITTISAYVVFGLAKARQAGFTVDQGVLGRGVQFLEGKLKAPKDLQPWQYNEQAFAIYALAEAGQMEPNRAGALFETREGLSLYGKAYLALALDLIGDKAAAARIKTLLADIGGKAVVSATSTHWEEGWTDYWNMNTDTRSTSIVLDALAKLDPQNSLAPNAVRWLMSARKADRWETTQENAWAIMALTDWMAATGELQGSYDWRVALNGNPLGQGTVTPATVQDVTTLRGDITRLLLDQTNSLTISRNASGNETGKGQLYYTAHLKTYQPVEQVAPLNRGVAVSREYRLVDCGQTDPKQTCPTITQAKVGDVIEVKLSVVVPHSLHYVIVEDPLPAGTEALDTSLKTTSRTVKGPALSQSKGPEVSQNGESAAPWSGWTWTPDHVELRDEKTVLFQTDLQPGTYEFTYQIRASLPGEFLTLPPTAYQMYFPEVWGRGAGGVFTVTE